MCWNNAKTYSEEKTTVQKFLSSYEQLKKSLKASNLFNYYNDFNYVPIGIVYKNPDIVDFAMTSFNKHHYLLFNTLLSI